MTPRHPSALPETLATTAFTTGEAFALDVVRGRVRGRDLDRSVYGVRSTPADTDRLLSRCRLFAARLDDDAFFSHSTAALIVGVPLPQRFERLARLHVTVAAPARAPHANGLIGHSRRVITGDVATDRSGLRVSAPPRLLCEMSSVLALPDLVAVVDHLIRRRHPSTSLARLAERLDVGDRIARSRILRRAVELADERSESRPESLVRVWCVLARLPRPEANHEISDPVTGRTLRLDLAWPERRLAIEYHGDYHRDPRQWRRDLTRKGRLESVGWRVIELHGGDLRDPTALVARIRSTLAG